MELNNEQLKYVQDAIFRYSRIVPKAYDMNGKKFNNDCHFQITFEVYEKISKKLNITIENAKQVVDNFLGN